MILRVIVISLLAFLLSPLGVSKGTAAETLEIHDSNTLRDVLKSLKANSTLRIGPGDYTGGLDVKGISHLTIEALEPQKPPRFVGGTYGWHFSNCSNLTLRNLIVSGQSRNGLNLDDGGQTDQPTTHVLLEGIAVREIGPRGNCDGIKCSGLDRVTIRSCSIEGWAGQGMDLVGCHRVLISGCQLNGKEGYSPSSGIQCKGGSEEVVIEKCQFTNAGQRPINAGGSTGLPYFRPQGAHFEARNVIIRDNQISGSLCACAFTGIDGATFRRNTILFPEKWVFRILQETTAPEFIPCRNVVIEENAIVFRRRDVAVEVNVGAKTAPETFRFAKNRWFAEDRPERSRPNLPTTERDGQYGIDPRNESSPKTMPRKTSPMKTDSDRR